MFEHRATLVPVGNVLTLTAAELGYNLTTGHSDHQLSAEALDGGTWTIEYLLHGDPTWRTHAAAVAASAISQISGLLLDGIRVTINGPGGAAVPKIYLTSRRTLNR